MRDIEHEILISNFDRILKAKYIIPVLTVFIIIVFVVLCFFVIPFFNSINDTLQTIIWVTLGVIIITLLSIMLFGVLYYVVKFLIQCCVEFLKDKEIIFILKIIFLLFTAILIFCFCSMFYEYLTQLFSLIYDFVNWLI